MSFFEHISPIVYQHYKPSQKVLGKTMEEHLRFAVCFWHTFCWPGTDQFGNAVFHRPWKTPEEKIKAGFEFIEKLGLKFFTFHDIDVAPAGVSLRKMADLIAKEMDRTGIQLLWGTANLTRHPRYMAGAATNPDPEVFACAVSQVKEIFDITHELGGHNYVLWGGREGYETLLNTDLKLEMEQLARFLSMLVEYKYKIGYKGAILIEPKPCEPAKHQYDFDAATVFAFLQKFGLEKEIKLNIETNHATLAGHTLAHEVAYAYANDLFGSIDANRGDPLLGWDTDQFPIDLADYTHVLYLMLENGGFTTGGFNFDAKVRRQSIDLQDLFDAHRSAVDALAKALLIAADLLKKGEVLAFMKDRYRGWHTGMGQKILKGEMTMESLSDYVHKHKLDPQPRSGRQEYLESFFF